jgi:hypothetical protein
VAVRAAYRQEDAAAAQGAAVRVWLLPRQLTVAAGDRFEVAVQVSADRPISHLPLTLVFDPSLLAVEAVAPGDFLGDSGKAEILADFSRPGEVVVGASRLGDQAGVTGAGNLVRVTFRALTAGSALVGFAGREALDNALRPVLPISVKPAHIEVQDGGGGNGGGGGGGGHRQPAKPAAPPASTPPASGASGSSGASGAGPSDG